MASDMTESLPETLEPALVKEKGSWLLEAQQALRNRGGKPFKFSPITIHGEPLSETIIRERRGEFDSPLS